MFSTFIQGFFLSAAMILPLGPQNVFVMQQGSRKQFHLMSATLCSTSDSLLIIAGIFGGSALLGQLSAELRPWFTTGAVMASISWFFALSFLSAWFAPVLNRPRAQRIINIFVGCVMWYIAWNLIQQGYRFFINYNISP
ncbi:LysE family transporter [Xenorhabdus griffiniae]|uniref:LysE family transporter n=1 Tax=Xenorhabdus griffiniae TaxID=351672 RepID=UPI002359AECB|nr:LysE family transporter [Xenorhabdus griffiniae]MDC9606253.1 LysE family transporter [Xenorhabdus griffiniae]